MARESCEWNSHLARDHSRLSTRRFIGSGFFTRTFITEPDASHECSVARIRFSSADSTNVSPDSRELGLAEECFRMPLRVKSTTARDTTLTRPVNASHARGSSEPFFCCPTSCCVGWIRVIIIARHCSRICLLASTNTLLSPHLHESRNLVPDVSPAGAKRQGLSIAPISCFSPHSLCLLYISQGQNHDTSNSPYVSA